jgi:hypothetical protein
LPLKSELRHVATRSSLRRPGASLRTWTEGSSSEPNVADEFGAEPDRLVAETCRVGGSAEAAAEEEEKEGEVM